MNKLYIFISIVFLLSACANGGSSSNPTKGINYIGVTIPDFKSEKIDSLITLYEDDREAFYKAKESNDIATYYKSKVGNKDSYNVTGFYDDVIKILNSDADTIELRKFQDYMRESSAKAKAFMNKPKEGGQ